MNYGTQLARRSVNMYFVQQIPSNAFIFSVIVQLTNEQRKRLFAMHVDCIVN